MKATTLTHLALVLFCLFTPIIASAQLPVISDVRLVMLPVDDVIIQTGADSSSSDVVIMTDVEYKFYFHINTLMDVASIHLNMGTGAGTSDLSSANFLIDQVPQAPLTYSRNNQLVEVSLGQMSYVEVVYADLFMEFSNGSFSEVISFDNSPD